MNRHQIFRRAATNSLFALLLFLAAYPKPANADERNARILRIEDRVLAPCCYDEPVSRHQSEIAVKMRMEIARWVAAGKSDEEIIGTYVQMYGDKVLLDPRTIPAPWTMWIPWLSVIAGAGFAAWLLKRWSAKRPVAATPAGPEIENLPDIEDED
jgi:cytochrome c-type biogenesis protein CcmH/NrfF